MAKDREVTQENKYFYKLGFMNGENRLQKTIEAVIKTNAHLMQELLRLDREQPVVGVLLDYNTIDKIIKAISKPLANRPLAKKIQVKRNKSRQKDDYAALMSIV